MPTDTMERILYWEVRPDGHTLRAINTTYWRDAFVLRPWPHRPSLWYTVKLYDHGAMRYISRRRWTRKGAVKVAEEWITRTAS